MKEYKIWGERILDLVEEYFYLLCKGGYIFGSVGLFACLSICLSVCLSVSKQLY